MLLADVSELAELGSRLMMGHCLRELVLNTVLFDRHKGESQVVNCTAPSLRLALAAGGADSLGSPAFDKRERGQSAKKML